MSDYPNVPTDSVHAASIAAVTGAGVAGGFTDGTFRPDDRVTRGHMAAFLAGALDLDPDSADVEGVTLTDVAADHDHAAAIALIVDQGIAGGFTDGTYRPQSEVSRAQMAAFLARAFDLLG